MQGFYNNICDNDHEIIGWYPNMGKKNLERGAAVTENVSDVGTGGKIMSEGEVEIVQVT